MPAQNFEIERFCDDLGPKKVIHVAVRSTDLRGMVVVDNTACGPAISGMRMVGDVSLKLVFRQARAMTIMGRSHNMLNFDPA